MKHECLEMEKHGVTSKRLYSNLQRLGDNMSSCKTPNKIKEGLASQNSASQSFISNSWHLRDICLSSVEASTDDYYIYMAFQLYCRRVQYQAILHSS